MSLRLSGGRLLRSPPGSVARPTPARVRLALLNLLAAELNGCRWLDLCAGSGAMACEVLQRGAAEVVAVERDRRLAGLARANLTAVQQGLSHGPPVQVHAAEALRWLRRSPPAAGSGGRRFDLVYADPPYASGLYQPIAAAVAAGEWLNPGGTLIWECGSPAVAAVPEGWQLRDRRRYGSTTLQLLQPE